MKEWLNIKENMAYLRAADRYETTGKDEELSEISSVFSLSDALVNNNGYLKKIIKDTKMVYDKENVSIFLSFINSFFRFFILLVKLLSLVELLSSSIHQLVSSSFLLAFLRITTWHAYIMIRTKFIVATMDKEIISTSSTNSYPYNQSVLIIIFLIEI